MSTVTSYVDTPIGRLELDASPRGLSALRFSHEPAVAPQGWIGARRDLDAEEHLAAAAEQLAAYFAGERARFDLPLDVAGTPFQRAVWEATSALSYATTCTYAELAARLGRPRAVRAVAAANARTPVPIVIACHRVVGSDGSLTGYRGGLGAKRALLALESAAAAAAA